MGNSCCCLYKDNDVYKLDICLPCKKNSNKEVEIIYNEFKNIDVNDGFNI